MLQALNGKKREVYYICNLTVLRTWTTRQLPPYFYWNSHSGKVHQKMGGVATRPCSEAGKGRQQMMTVSCKFCLFCSLRVPSQHRLPHSQSKKKTSGFLMGQRPRFPRFHVGSNTCRNSVKNRKFSFIFCPTDITVKKKKKDILVIY